MQAFFDFYPPIKIFVFHITPDLICYNLKVETKKRLKYIDIARGFAMLIIVLSHTILPTDGSSYAVYRFLFFINVPIFFVLSTKKVIFTLIKQKKRPKWKKRQKIWKFRRI